MISEFYLLPERHPVRTSNKMEYYSHGHADVVEDLIKISWNLLQFYSKFLLIIMFMVEIIESDNIVMEIIESDNIMVEISESDNIMVEISESDNIMVEIIESDNIMDILFYYRLAYKLTHLYYNWPGTIRVPAPCQVSYLRVARCLLRVVVWQNKRTCETFKDDILENIFNEVLNCIRSKF